MAADEPRAINRRDRMRGLATQCPIHSSGKSVHWRGVATLVERKGAAELALIQLIYILSVRVLRDRADLFKGGRGASGSVGEDVYGRIA
jgi:hypothetical protein